MKRESLKLYFVALVPTEPICSQILALKKEFSHRFGSSAALRSPPHITLQMPFQKQEEKEELLVSSLDKLARHHASFKLSLSNFGAFPPKVIYLNVDENAQLNDLQKAVQKNAVSHWHIYPKANSRPFKPHITVAFRDLKKPKFYAAWQEFDHREFKTEFIVYDVCLLKHNGKTWDVLHKSTLGK